MSETTPGRDSCGCPETDGNTYHQRGTCTDPAVAALDWYADGPAQPVDVAAEEHVRAKHQPETASGRAAYEVWRAAVPDYVCNVPAGPWEDLPETIQAGFNAIAAQERPAASEPLARPTADGGMAVMLADEIAAAKAAPEASPLGLKHAVTSNRLGHALAALREIKGANDAGTQAHDTAHAALDDDAAIRDNVALTREPHAAPELAEHREFVGEIVGELRQALGADPDGDAEPGEAPEALAVRLARYLKHRIDELHGLVAEGEPQPAPELAKLRADFEAERGLRLRLAGERDEARSDFSRLRRVLLEGGQSDAAARKRCLAIVQTAGTLPVDAPLDAQRAPTSAPEARHWDGAVNQATRLIDWILAAGGTARYHDGPSAIAIDAPGCRTIMAVPGDWVVKLPSGAFRVLSEDALPAKTALDLLDDFTHAVIDIAGGKRLVTVDRVVPAARSARKKAGLPPVEGQ